jgi:hypothetical protein
MARTDRRRSTRSRTVTARATRQAVSAGEALASEVLRFRK